MATDSFKKIPPLDWQTPMVNPKTGNPSPQFLRLWQEMFKNGDFVNLTLEETQALIAAKADKATLIDAGVGLSGGGDLSADLTIDLEDTTVTAGSYTNADITVDAQGRLTAAANGSGGGGGGGGTIGYAFSETATAGLNISSETLIPDMTETFSLSSTQDVFIEFSCLLTRSSGQCRFILKIDGVNYGPISGNQRYYSVNQNENNVHNGNFSYIINLTSGSHTVEVFAADALAVSTTTFWNRCLKISGLT